MGILCDREQPAIEEEQPPAIEELKPEIRVESEIHDFIKEMKKGSEAIESIEKKFDEYEKNKQLRETDRIDLMNPIISVARGD